MDGQQSDQPMGTITEPDIAQAVAEGKNPDEVRIRELMASHPDRHQHGAEHP
jgi:hypothetical protein